MAPRKKQLTRPEISIPRELVALLLKPLTSLLIKPAGPDCNLACTYCFYAEKSGLFPAAAPRRMSEETLELLVQQAMEQGGEEISFGWQGGEPTLMGRAFFERAVELQRRYGHDQVIGNGMQTNGMLLDEEWAEFFRRNKFLVGLSLDGPEHVHDHYRRTAGGGGTWARVHDRAKMLLDRGVEVNSLIVVNDYSAQFAEEIYAFHKDLGLSYLQFIPCVETDPGGGRAAPFSVTAPALGRFWIALYDLWRADFREGRPTTSVRFFDSIFYRYVGLEPPECTLLGECGNYLVVEHDGGVYACDFFVGPQWKLGDLRHHRLYELLNSPRQTAFGRMKADLPELCRRCRWRMYCRGGCTKDRLRDPRDGKLSHFCAAYQQFFAHAHDDLRELAARWRAEQGPETAKPLADERKTGRNDPCPCGSGKKFKKCCGA